MADSEKKQSGDAPPAPHRAFQGHQLTVALLCIISALDGLDQQLLPTSYRALESSLGLSPSRLAVLSACQGLALALAGPFWGALADSGFSRRNLLVFGACSWGALTMLLAVVNSFGLIVLLRILNGATLGMLLPIVQSIVADEAVPCERGLYFGWCDLSQHVGMMAATLVVTPISSLIIWGVFGWRWAFAAVGVVSFLVALATFIGMKERSRAWKPEQLNLGHEFKKFYAYFQIPSFVVIVSQGIVGAIPGCALNFSTMYFQYAGLGDALAGTAYTMTILGQAVGAVVGGVVADRLAIWSPDHGRALAAQISVFSGIPIVAAIFLLPPSATHFATYAVLCLIMGLTSSWCKAGVNMPILADVVSPGNRASIASWEYCFQSVSAQIIGSLGVGAVAERVYGYQTSTQQVADMPDDVRLQNAKSLGMAMLVFTVVPWTLCLIIYCFLHRTYKTDRDRALQERRAADENTPLHNA